MSLSSKFGHHQGIPTSFGSDLGSLKCKSTYSHPLVACADWHEETVGLRSLLFAIEHRVAATGFCLICPAHLHMSRLPPCSCLFSRSLRSFLCKGRLPSSNSCDTGHYFYRSIVNPYLSCGDRSNYCGSAQFVHWIRKETYTSWAKSGFKILG